MDFSSSTPARFAAMLALILTLLVFSGVALSQEGDAGQNNPGSSGASSAVKPQTIDDATLKRTAKAFVKVRRIVLSAQQEINRSSNDEQKQQIIAQAKSDKIDAVSRRLATAAVRSSDTACAGRYDLAAKVVVLCKRVGKGTTKGRVVDTNRWLYKAGIQSQ